LIDLLRCLAGCVCEPEAIRIVAVEPLDRQRWPNGSLMRFQFEQRIALPRPVVFAFHEDPEHLVLLHEGWAAFRMIHHSGRVNQESKIWFETTIAGILPVAMGFEHIVYEPPLRIGEQLIHGPFRKFTHTHEFDEINTGTIVRDLLDVELPWYYGGEFVMKLFVAPMLQRAFRLRGETLLKLAQTGVIG
jgi:ligand-binding SRPBCC domain-containing protein